MSMFADDTSLCHQSLDLTQINKARNSDLSKLETWLQGNEVSLNVENTQSMLIPTTPSTMQKHTTVSKVEMKPWN